MAKKKRQVTTPSWLVWFIIGTISFAWVVNAALRFLVSSYEPWVGLDPLMLAVVGFLLATKNNQGEDEEDDDPEPRPETPPSPPSPPPVVLTRRQPTPHRIWADQGVTPEGGDE